MSVDTFPELTPPVLIVGEVAPGLAAKDVEKAVAWRIERYVAATPGVDHVESLSRNNFALIYVWLKWGTDLSAAQTLVQSEAAFAMAGAPKSLGLLPPFVLQYDPSNAPVCQIVITGAGYSGSQLYDYAQNYIEPQIEGIDGVGSAPVDGGRPRQINVVVDPVKAQARHVTAEDVAAAVGQRQRAPALGRVHRAEASTPTSTPTASPRTSRPSAKARSRWSTASRSCIKDVARRRRRRHAADAGRLRQRPGRRLPQRPAHSRRQHDRRSSTPSRTRSRT